MLYRTVHPVQGQRNQLCFILPWENALWLCKSCTRPKETPWHQLCFILPLDNPLWLCTSCTRPREIPKGTSSVLFCLGRMLYGSVHPAHGPGRPQETSTVLFCLGRMLYGSVNPVHGPGRPQGKFKIKYDQLFDFRRKGKGFRPSAWLDGWLCKHYSASSLQTLSNIVWSIYKRWQWIQLHNILKVHWQQLNGLFPEWVLSCFFKAPAVEHF